jgi:hypothetical protein
MQLAVFVHLPSFTDYCDVHVSEAVTPFFIKFFIAIFFLRQNLAM